MGHQFTTDNSIITIDDATRKLIEKSYVIESEDADWILRFMILAATLRVTGYITIEGTKKYKLKYCPNVDDTELFKKIEALSFQPLRQGQVSDEGQKIVLKTTNNMLLEALEVLAKKVGVDYICSNDIIWGKRIEIQGNDENMKSFKIILAVLRLL